MTDILEAALSARRAGLNVLPPCQDGTKAPEGRWAERQAVMATEAEILQWYEDGRRTGLGLICGPVSGGLEMLEFEARAVEEGVNEQFLRAAEAAGLADVLDRVIGGYLEWTPTGGCHLLYRCLEVEGNQKLARRLATAEELAENPDERINVLVETRGRGGFVIVAPSNGHVHPSGRPWRLAQGGFETIATISPEERRELLRLARTFDRMPKPEARPAQSPSVGSKVYDGGDGDIRPGEDFNARSKWADILEPAGWTYLFTASDRNQHWRRPGKKIGTSATIADDGEGPLYVFSTSTPFETDIPYSRFAAFAVLNHGGDYSAAAKALAVRGYGTRRESKASNESSPATRREVTRSGGISLVWGNEVQPRALRWLWPGRMPAGKLTICEGDPGLGKSLVTVDLAARQTRGAALPGCEPSGEPRRVLIASAEDTIDDVILPRFVAAGGRRELVAFHRLSRDPDSGKVVPLTIPRDLDRLAETIVAHDIPFVVLDPLVAFLGEEIRTHVDASVRQAMGPLSIMAEETGTSVVALRHLNKSKDDNPVYRGGGSIAFTGAARSVLLFGRHPDDETLHVLAQGKTNLSAHGTASSLGYRIEETDGPYGPQPVVAWLAEPLGITAAELLRRGGRDDAPKRSEAEDFLADVLADGPVAVEDIKQLASSAGLSWRTVERAKGRVEVRVERRRDGTGKTVGWCWSLPIEPPEGAF